MNISPYLPTSILLIVFLSGSRITQFSGDANYFLGFILFPFFLLVMFKTPQPEKTDTFHIKDYSAPIFVCIYSLYILANWYLLGSPYFGTRGMVYQWFCFWGFILGGFFLFRTEKRFQTTAVILLCVCTISSIYSILEYLLIVPPAVAWPPRISGLFNNKNVFGLFIIFGIVISCHFLFSHKQKKFKLISAGALIIQLSAQILGDCRGGLALTFLALAGTLIPLTYKYLKQFIWIRYGFYLFLFCLGLVPILFWSDSSWARVVRLIVNPDMDTSAQLRLLLYQSNFSLFFKEPLFGSGIGNYILSVIPFQSELVLDKISNFKFALNAESDYLEVLTESGIIGLTFYLTIMLGALAFGISRLRKKWNQQDYVMLVLLLIMLMSATYDTALRHLPTGVVFWATAGYFWREKLKPVEKIGTKGKNYIKTGILVVHFILAIFFIRILAGDFFYIKYVASQYKDIPQIAKALDICPFHPDALYNAAFIEADHNGTSSIRDIADQLDATSPNYRPTDYLRAISFYNEGQYDSSYKLIQRELEAFPSHFPLQKLRLHTLAKIGKCAEFERYRDSLTIGLKKPEMNLKHKAVISGYKQGAGTIRTILNENKTKLMYIRHRLNVHNKQTEIYQKKTDLKKITCIKQKENTN